MTKFYIPPADIPGGVPQSQMTELTRLKIQNQKLLEACKEARDHINDLLETPGIGSMLAPKRHVELAACRLKLDLIIAKVESEKQ